MKQILFVSSQTLSPQLELCLSELNQKGFRFVTIREFSKVIKCIKNSLSDTVIIDSSEQKLESYELAKEIKQFFKSSIKVFVYLPDSSLNEASKFGLVNAEVEDEKSISTLVNKISSGTDQEFFVEENFSSIYGLDGGIGSSTIALILSEYLSKNSSKVLIAETTSNFSLKSLLKLEDDHAILANDYSKNYSQSRDLDWFRAFLNESLLMQGVYYLNLFNNLQDKKNYFLNQSNKLNQLREDLSKLARDFESSNELLFTKQDLISSLLTNADLLKIISKELSGESFGFFFEIMQLGSQLVNNFIFDLGTNLFSSLNRQVLRMTKNLIFVFRDNINLKEEYLKQKLFLEEEFKLKIIPVLVPNPYQQNSYKTLSERDWKNLIGEVPLIYPYCPEAIASFIFDHEPLTRHKKINQFARLLVSKVDPKFTLARKSPQFLKFEEKKSLINWR